MDKEQDKIASGEQSQAAACGPSPGPGCSKSDSATPLTDALFAKCKARPTDGSGSRDGGWGAADIADFLRHSRKLEIALGMTAAALRDISGAKAADDVPLYAKSFELLGRIQGIASVALASISTLNTRHRDAHDMLCAVPGYDFAIDLAIEYRNAAEGVPT